MSLKNRVGNFFLLGGLVFLLIFIASLLAPQGGYDLTALLVGVLCFGLGWHWRLAKGAPRPAGPPPGSSGPPNGAPPPKKRSALGTFFKGPRPKPKAGPPPTLNPPPPPRKGLFGRKK